MVEIDARQARALAQGVLDRQFRRAGARTAGDIKRRTFVEGAWQIERTDQLLQAGNRLQTVAIDIGRSFEAVQIGEFAQRAIDLPLQHRGTGRRASESRMLAIHHRHLMALCRQVLGHHCAGDAGADDQHLASMIPRKLDALGTSGGRPGSEA